MLQLFSTLSRKQENFQPLVEKEASLYSCGPTVYSLAHLGNFRAFIFVDILKRVLLHNGLTVKHIMNITDVGHLTGDRDMGEDKLAQAAAAEHKTAWEIASYYTEAFLSDARSLNILLPDKLPKATDHIEDMISLIKKLEDKGFTYKTSDGIYFDTSKLSDYGKLARLDLEGLKEGTRVEINREKRNPTDFALWKFSYPSGRSFDSAQDDDSKRRHMEWNSPWGVGFPGWHIECSAMSVRYLGQPFDIHTGGVDHIPLHHTNEIAQTEAATGKPLAAIWMHNEYLLAGASKLAKSDGRGITLDEVKKKGFNPLSFRYLVLGAHYRSKINFSWEALSGAQNALDNIYAKAAEADESKVGCAEYEKHFFAALDDDLDTPKALAIVWEMLRSDYPPEAKLSSLLEFDKVLGLSVRENRDELRQPLPAEIKKLVTEREERRRNQDWQASDRLRKKIESLGFEVRDAKTGPLVKRKK